MRRFVARCGPLLLAAAPACLLYTDPINSPPTVVIMAPASMHINETSTFRGQVSDPDGDPVTLQWAVADGACGAISAAEWDGARRTGSDPLFPVHVGGHGPFCVRLLAHDRHGARSVPRLFEGKAQNRAPVTSLAVEPAQVASGSFPLYTAFRLTAGPAADVDGDPVVFTWKATDPSGADVTAALTACDPAQPETVRCLSADKPGMYSVSVDASDGLAEGKGMSKLVTLSVLEDAAPCIELTSPAAETGVVVLAVDAPPRAFEVRRVRDDGHPFPAGPHGATTFQWFTARDGSAAWTRELGYDRPSFDVSAARFPDVRPGSVYKVRVEARDPQHESAAELRALEATCGDAPLCMVPDKCLRWVTWSVRFQ